MDIHCIILWHYFDKEKKLVNSSITRFKGTMEQLSSRIQEANEEATTAQIEGKGYSLVQQLSFY